MTALRLPAGAVVATARTVLPGYLSAWQGGLCVWAGPIARWPEGLAPAWKIDRLLLNPGTYAELKEKGLAA